jgi:uncharacterized delta-60 repeat protein
MKKATVVLALVIIVGTGVSAVPGLLDFSFNGTGIAVTDFAIAGIGSYHDATGITTDRSGRTVVAGVTTAGVSLTLYEAAISRYHPDGSLDTTFNGTGKVVHDFGGDDHVAGVATDGLNRVIVGGYTNWHAGCVNKVDCGDNYNFFVGRFNEDGSVDTTFADGGRKIIGFGSDDDYAYDLLIDPQGRIVLAGSTHYDPGILSRERAALAIARVLPSGAFDTSFGGDGTVIGDAAPTRYSVANAIAIDHNGRLVIASDVGGWPYIFTMDDNGSFSSGYTAPYIAQIPWRNDCNYSRFTDVAVDQSNRIIATGYCNETSADGTAIIILRALPDGSFDTTFGTSGVIAESFGAGAQQGRSVVVDGLGRVTIAGYVSDCGRDFFISRVLADGSVDHSFGPNANGQAAINIGSGSCSGDEAHELTFDRQGRFMLAGSTTTSAGTNFAVVRVLDEDPGFDFLLPVAPIVLVPGTSANTNVTIFSIDGFNELLKIRPSSIPAGVTLSFDGQGPVWQVTPPANGSSTAVLTVTVSALVVPGVYTIPIFDDRFQDVADITVNVVASLPMLGMTVTRFVEAGYIDNAGVGGAMQRMLQQADDLAAGGNPEAAASVLKALANYIDAQAGRHIATTATENGITFNPADILSQHVLALTTQLLVASP